MKLANFLKIAAVLVIAPRYASAFASLLGANPLAIAPWLLHLEMLSGAAMALLEAATVSFIFGKWRLLPQESNDRRVLSRMLILLMLTIPIVPLPSVLAAQVSEITIGSMPIILLIFWNLAVLGTPALLVAAVGFADQDIAELELYQAKQKQKIKQSKLTSPATAAPKKQNSKLTSPATAAPKKQNSKQQKAKQKQGELFIFEN